MPTVGPNPPAEIATATLVARELMPQEEMSETKEQSLEKAELMVAERRFCSFILHMASWRGRHYLNFPVCFL